MTHVKQAISQQEIEQCFQIRRQVFIEEQSVAEDLELDGLDHACVHFLAFEDSSAALQDAIGTARLWIDDQGRAKAQRVAILKPLRGHGYGRHLMEALENHAALLGHHEIWLGAQIQAMQFYERQGYAAKGEMFLDANIPHKMMVKAI